MKNITEELGIKTLNGLGNHITAALDNAVDLECVKTGQVIRVYWAFNSILYKYNITSSLIHDITVTKLDDAISFIRTTLKH
jgi:hypothetical protein